MMKDKHFVVTSDADVASTLRKYLIQVQCYDGKYVFLNKAEMNFEKVTDVDISQLDFTNMICV